MKISSLYGFKPERDVVSAVIESSLDYDGRLSGWFAGNKMASANYDSRVFHEMDKLTAGQYNGGIWDMVEVQSPEHGQPCFFLCLEPGDTQ